jgi:hypothetical protein
MTLQTTLVDRQQIPNTRQWTNLEAVSSTRSVRHLLDATREERRNGVFYAVRAEVLRADSQWSSIDMSGVKRVG